MGSISIICEDRIYKSVLEGVPRRLTLDTYWLISDHFKGMVMKDVSVTCVKLGSSFMHPV